MNGVRLLSESRWWVTHESRVIVDDDRTNSILCSEECICSMRCYSRIVGTEEFEIVFLCFWISTNNIREIWTLSRGLRSSAERITRDEWTTNIELIGSRGCDRVLCYKAHMNIRDTTCDGDLSTRATSRIREDDECECTGLEWDIGVDDSIRSLDDNTPFSIEWCRINMDGTPGVEIVGIGEIAPIPDEIGNGFTNGIEKLWFLRWIKTDSTIDSCIAILSEDTNARWSDARSGKIPGCRRVDHRFWVDCIRDITRENCWFWWDNRRGNERSIRTSKAIERVHCPEWDRYDRREIFSAHRIPWTIIPLWVCSHARFISATLGSWERLIWWECWIHVIPEWESMDQWRSDIISRWGAQYCTCEECRIPENDISCIEFWEGIPWSEVKDWGRETSIDPVILATLELDRSWCIGRESIFDILSGHRDISRSTRIIEIIYQ